MLPDPEANGDQVAAGAKVQHHAEHGDYLAVVYQAPLYAVSLSATNLYGNPFLEPPCITEKMKKDSRCSEKWVEVCVRLHVYH